MSFTLTKHLPEPTYIQKIEDNKIDPLDFPEGPGVYVMISKQDEILYTGKTKNLSKRIHYHKHKSHNIDVKEAIKNGDIKEIKIFCCQTELDATILERYFIQANIYCGIYNIKFTSESESELGTGIIFFDDEQEALFLENKIKRQNKRKIQWKIDYVYQEVSSGKIPIIDDLKLIKTVSPADALEILLKVKECFSKKIRSGKYLTQMEIGFFNNILLPELPLEAKKIFELNAKLFKKNIYKKMQMRSKGILTPEEIGFTCNGGVFPIEETKEILKKNIYKKIYSNEMFTQEEISFTCKAGIFPIAESVRILDIILKRNFNIAR